jgi:hypothetical protein
MVITSRARRATISRARPGGSSGSARSYQRGSVCRSGSSSYKVEPSTTQLRCHVGALAKHLPHALSRSICGRAFRLFDSPRGGLPLTARKRSSRWTGFHEAARRGSGLARYGDGECTTWYDRPTLAMSVRKRIRFETALLGAETSGSRSGARPSPAASARKRILVVANTGTAAAWEGRKCHKSDEGEQPHPRSSRYLMGELCCLA